MAESRVIPIQPVAAPMPAASRGAFLSACGLFLRRNRRLVLAVQWLVVLFYLGLVIVPSFLPIPPESAHIWDNLRLFAQFAFWGVWWPGVMIATITLGRVWCGLFCPEGAMSEWASRFGRGKPVPRWLKWPGWPFVAFVCTTVYGQLVSVYEYPQAALLVLGGSTVAAIVVGVLYGRDRRIWCRYLCPASGVFAVLARIAPLHYKVDRAAWDHDTNHFEPVKCGPLVDIRRMQSASECHACGRCAGQRGAVQLSARSPAAEILDADVQVRTPEALTLLFGVLGVASAAFQWTVSPWFLHLKLRLADWLVEHDHFTLLDNDVPWWLLTHYPEVGDTFTWLDGGLILAYLLIGGGLLGTLLWMGPALASRLLAAPRLTWQRLALTLTPMAAASVILGLSMLTLSHLKAEHVWLGWVPAYRVTLLTLGCLGSLWLAFGLLRQAGASLGRRLAAGFALAWPVGLMAANWTTVFFIW